MNRGIMNEQVQRKTTVLLEADVAEMMGRYILAVNERSAPAKLSQNGLINEAIRQYVEKGERAIALIGTIQERVA
jgi:hypothetical protein